MQYAVGMRSKIVLAVIKVKKELMDILACPVCKGDLVLNVVEENEEEVISGTLYCPACKERYSIEGGIPNLLPPELRG